MTKINPELSNLYMAFTANILAGGNTTGLDAKDYAEFVATTALALTENFVELFDPMGQVGNGNGNGSPIKIAE